MGEEELDQEWVELIIEARNSGIKKEDIILFLKEGVLLSSFASNHTEKEIFE